MEVETVIHAVKNQYFVAHIGESLLLEVTADCYKNAIKTAYQEWGWGVIEKDDVHVVSDELAPLILASVTARAASEIGRFSDVEDKIVALQKLNGARHCIVSDRST